MTSTFPESSQTRPAHAHSSFTTYARKETEGGGGGGGGGPGSPEMRPPLQAHEAAVFLSRTMAGQSSIKSL